MICCNFKYTRTRKSTQFKIGVTNLKTLQIKHENLTFACKKARFLNHIKIGLRTKMKALTSNMNS